MSGKLEIPYGEIPGFPRTTVAGHQGTLLFGLLEGVPVVAMKGRFHHYEGHDMDTVAYPIRVFRRMGIENLLLTNAAGGVNHSFVPGDLMALSDHIGLWADSPLRGPNEDMLGPRFPDMSKVYDPLLVQLADSVADNIGFVLKHGVYAWCRGPAFETPAEIRALRVLGADAVGMSTVPEAVAARHMGMRILAISCITNMAAGMLDQPLTHEEVMQTGKMVEKRFSALISGIAGQWGRL
jgi:purine-nucleoside phosphorylase